MKKISKLLIGTNNKGKYREIKDLLPKYIKTHSTSEFKLKSPRENGLTFSENSIIKSKYFSKKTKFICLADDSGLEIDILDKRPGIYSARYADSGQDRDNCLKLLENLKAIKDPQRTARFKCCLVGFYKGKIIKSFGSLDGEISTEFKGESGFGYDPIFITKSGFHLAELKKEEKNLISHRSAAFTKLLKEILKLIS